MRVIFVSTYPPEHCGIGRDTFLLTKSLQDLRPVSVMANIVPGAALEEGSVSRVWRKNELRYPLAIVRKIERISKPSEAIVHLHHHFNLYGGPPTVALFPLLLILLRTRGYRVVVHFHSVIDPRELGGLMVPGTQRSSKWLVTRLLRVFVRLVASYSDRQVVCTASMRDMLVERYGLAAGKVSVMPVGWYEVDPASLKPPTKETLGLAQQTVIMFHSFLDPTKGLEDLLRAFASIHRSHPNTHLVLAGEVAPNSGAAGRAYVRALEKQVSDLSIQDAVTFMGYQDEANLTRTLAAADIFVLPYTMLASLGGSGSLSRLAGFGKPLVASRITRFADEIIDGETGLLVTPGHPEEIAAALQRLLDDPTLANRLGENLRSLAARRTWRASAELLDRTLYPSLQRATSN